MARDYKYAEVFSPGTRPMPAWIWVFAVCAIAGFVSLIYYLDRYERSKAGTEQVTRKLDLGQNSTSSNSADGNAGQTEEDKPSFDFYKLLPIQEVDVPKTARDSGSSADNSADNDNTGTSAGLAGDSDSVAKTNIKNNAKSNTPAIVSQDGKQSSPPSTILPAQVSKSTANNGPITNRPVTAFVLQAGSFKDYKEADKLKASLALQGIVARIEKVELKANQVWHRVRIGPITSQREVNRIRERLRSQNIEPVTFKVNT